MGTSARTLRAAFALFAILLLAGGPAAQADVFSMGPDRLCGAVDYDYRIGKHEVTAGQYCEFLNAVAHYQDWFDLYNPNMDTAVDSRGCGITRSGSDGNCTFTVSADRANRPVNYVSWGDAARFANWLQNGQPKAVDVFMDWSATGYGAYYIEGAVTEGARGMVQRETDWQWAVPTEDEWYKAAYHMNDGVTGNYFDYPTRSDSPPGHDMTEATDPGNNANSGWLGSPYYCTEVGEYELSVSPYGTFDQGGNVAEWTETVVGPYVPEMRLRRGGVPWGLNMVYGRGGARRLPLLRR
jgi:formylglycine-generating enzyme required for sulfatase activity